VRFILVSMCCSEAESATGARQSGCAEAHKRQGISIAACNDPWFIHGRAVSGESMNEAAQQLGIYLSARSKLA